jgi:hypothetical protein
MNALAETYEGAEMRASGYGRQRGWSFLKRIVERLAVEDRQALRTFPDEDEIRLAWFALGRGFDCM